jgi:nicotinamidase-related amidase
MRALIIIDAQNEFSPLGKRPVPDHSEIVSTIGQRVEKARGNNYPIAWIRHFNKPTESPAFVPGTWGAEFVEGLGPKPGLTPETEFQKNVYGAFTGTNIGLWLKDLYIGAVEIAGFYTHGCVSTTAREAIMAGLDVYMHSAATGACDMEHEIVGFQTAEEVRRTALLQLSNMGVILVAHD